MRKSLIPPAVPSKDSDIAGPGGENNGSTNDDNDSDGGVGYIPKSSRDSAMADGYQQVDPCANNSTLRCCSAKGKIFC